LKNPGTKEEALFVQGAYTYKEPEGKKYCFYHFIEIDNAEL
jgi:hypothetical protein